MMGPYQTRGLLAVGIVTVLLVAGLAAGHYLRPPTPSNGPEAQLKQAKEAIAAREYPKATAHLTHCLESWPFNAEVHFLMARTYRRAGQINLGKTYLRRAAVLQWPKKQIDFERQLQRAQTGDVWTVEDPLIDKLNEQPPEEVMILEALVNGFLVNDRLDDVIAFTSTWIKRYPEDWLPLIYRANARLGLFGRNPDATKDFERLLELKPGHPEAHLALAAILSDAGQFSQALPHFLASLESQPDDPGALFGLANCQHSLGNEREAQEALGRLFARGKDDPPGFFLQAKIDLAEGRPEDALKWLKKAEALAPNEADLTNMLFLVYRQLGNAKEADKYQRLMHEIRARDSDLDRLVKALKVRPNDAELRFQVAMMCLKLGRDAEAAHWFQGILFKDPFHQPTLNALADYYQSHGNQKMADHYRRKIHKESRTPYPSQ